VTGPDTSYLGDTGPGLSVRGEGDGRTLILTGELDLATAHILESALDRHCGDPDAAGDVTLDLAALDFMDSTGIKFLIDGRDTARERGVRLSLVPGDDPVRRVLTVSGVTALFEAVDDDEPRRD
jgi:anti-anti-sigma factor